MSPLKTCPFCGSEPERRPWHGGGPGKTLVGCINERCEASPCVTGETPSAATAKWNRRKAR